MPGASGGSIPLKHLTAGQPQRSKALRMLAVVSKAGVGVQRQGHLAQLCNEHRVDEIGNLEGDTRFRRVLRLGPGLASGPWLRLPPAPRATSGFDHLFQAWRIMPETEEKDAPDHSTGSRAVTESVHLDTKCAQLMPETEEKDAPDPRFHGLAHHRRICPPRHGVNSCRKRKKMMPDPRFHRLAHHRIRSHVPDTESAQLVLPKMKEMRLTTTSTGSVHLGTECATRVAQNERKNAPDHRLHRICPSVPGTESAQLAKKMKKCV